MATVTFDHVYKRYGADVIAVNDLNLAVGDGEFLVLVGPSGCGKTTALRCVAGLEEISEGRVLIGDTVVNEMAPKDRDIAMVFQSYALYPHMSVYDNMAFGLKLRKTPKEDIDRRVRAAADILDLTPYLDRKPKALSGGQRQRVALGRAIVREPKVFLMDEPLSNLDAKLRVQTRAEISRLRHRLGTTTIYVTHDQIEAMTMGDRIAVMKDGILQQAGTPEDLYDKPMNVFVAGFIGSPAMNFATAKVSGDSLTFGTARATLGGASSGLAAGRSELLVGFRPEHLLVGEAGDGALHIPAAVDVVEYLGNDEMVHAQADGKEIVAMLDAAKHVKVGDSVEFTVPLDKLHIFDPASQQRLA
jgi:multiple sugar transport system ATP-binding protein